MRNFLFFYFIEFWNLGHFKKIGNIFVTSFQNLDIIKIWLIFEFLKEFQLAVVVVKNDPYGGQWVRFGKKMFILKISKLLIRSYPARLVRKKKEDVD